jgi:GH15 family glucan-1,4-alpha-glucosidase
MRSSAAAEQRLWSAATAQSIGCAGPVSTQLPALPPCSGRWLIAPKHPPLGVRRRYRPGALVLETEFQTETGCAAIIDFMPPADGADLVRIVIGRSGRVVFHTELVVGFNYGSAVPWVNRLDDGTINAIAGPERLVLRTPAVLRGEDLKTLGEFTVEVGQCVPFVLSYGLSFQNPPPAIDPFDALERTEAFWRQWLPELTVPWLPGYENSRPVRIGNAASQQLQTDIFGEIADAMFQARKAGMARSERGRALRSVVLEHLEAAWRQPDEGIWETRGGRQHFVHSKVMAWVAFDRAANEPEAQAFNESGRRWREIADEIHAEFCERGFDPRP